MRKKANYTGAALSEKRLLSTAELSDYIGIGLQNARKISEAAGATVKIGKLVRHSRARIDEYLNGLH